MNIILSSLYDLGMKISIGLGGLYKTFNGINNHVILKGIGPMKNLPCFNSIIYIIYYVIVNIIPFFPLWFGYENPY